MITEEQYKKVNQQGLTDGLNGHFHSFYTPVLQIAYNLGLDGISIQGSKSISAFRFGKAPESFISWNYRDNAPEKGLSVYTEESIVRAEFSDRKKYDYAGLPVIKGGDGEIIILAYDAENYDL